jgi:hypothetical protein
VTHRMRMAVVLVSAVLMALPAAAWAGPSEKQPAQVRLTLGEARYYARTGASYLADGLASPSKPHLGKCSTLRGRLLWACPATVEGTGVRCSVIVWVWGSRNADRYYEYHQLRCGSP